MPLHVNRRHGLAGALSSPLPASLMSAATLAQGLARGWRWLLQAGLLLLCVRFQVAAVREILPDAAPALLLAITSFVLAWWRPEAALFAFTLALPLLSGLGITALLHCAAPVTLVFSAMYIGASLHRGDGNPLTSPPPGRRALAVAADVLITVMLLSLALQLWRHRATPQLVAIFWGQSTLGHGGSFYFITAAFLWIQGLAYFRWLDAAASEPRRWLKPVFLTLSVAMAVFHLLQRVWKLPDPNDTTIASSPFEEFHAFGSIALVAFVFSAAQWQPPARVGRRQSLLWALSALGALALVGASWSRTAWLAAGLFLLLTAALRLDRRWLLALAVAVAAAFAVIVANAQRPEWKKNPYLDRLISLTQPRTAGNDLSGRVYIYQKATALIRARPLTGHGVGAFFLTSVHYASPGDPAAAEPNFAHHFALQFVAESGLPAAAVLAGLIGLALWRGWRDARFENQSRGIPTGEFQSGLEVLGLVLALAAYLFTQSTANSLNIFVSNQFLFWLLMAAALVPARPRQA